MFFLAYLVLALVFSRGYALIIIFNGRLADYICRPDSLNKLNNDVTEIEQ